MCFEPKNNFRFTSERFLIRTTVSGTLSGLMVIIRWWVVVLEGFWPYLTADCVSPFNFRRSCVHSGRWLAEQAFRRRKKIQRRRIRSDNPSGINLVAWRKGQSERRWNSANGPLWVCGGSAKCDKDDLKVAVEEKIRCEAKLPLLKWRGPSV